MGTSVGFQEQQLLCVKGHEIAPDPFGNQTRAPTRIDDHPPQTTTGREINRLGGSRCCTWVVSVAHDDQEGIATSHVGLGARAVVRRLVLAKEACNVRRDLTELVAGATWHVTVDEPAVVEGRLVSAAIDAALAAMNNRDHQISRSDALHS